MRLAGCDHVYALPHAHERTDSLPLRFLLLCGLDSRFFREFGRTDGRKRYLASRALLSKSTVYVFYKLAFYYPTPL